MLAVACAACGENAHPEELFEATSGTRLELQRYRFDDGAELATADELYDRELHARCAPGRWSDGTVRCIPAVEDAVYTDAACTMLAGRALAIAKPALFLAYETTGAGVRPARLFRAGAAIDPVAEYYEMKDGACTGPLPSPADPIEYFAVGDDLGGEALVAIRDVDAGEGRLAVQVRESDDGARIPFGLRDRDLGAACTPSRDDGGGIVCAPAGAAPAGTFRDPACTAPVVIVAAGESVPAIAAVVRDSGCTGYRIVAGGLAGGPLYRRAGDACAPMPAPPGARLFAVGAELSLAELPRVLEEVPGRRLQRVILEAGELRIADDRLFDTATRADCRHRLVGDVTRCIPEAVATARTLYAPGCGIAISVAELPRRTCEPVAFATAPAGVDFEIRAIGDRAPDALFRLENGQCLPNPGSGSSPSETSLRTLGPPIDPSAFVGAVYYGAR
jgi:hypothetical protein